MGGEMMTPSLKKICIFGLASGLGQIVREQIMDPEKKAKYFADLNQDEIELLLWHCTNIETTGKIALDKTKAKKDNSKMRQASRKIVEAAGTLGEIDVLKMLSFLFLGLTELEHYCNDKDIIKEVREVATGFMTQFDPNLELDDIHAEAHEQYKRWIA